MRAISGARAAALAFAMVAAASGHDLKWSDLAPVAEGRKAAVTLHDGSRVKGKVLGVSSEGLRMVAGKQEVLVPRREVARLRVSRTTKHWRHIGTVIGLGAGLPPAVVLHTYLNNEGASSPLVALAAVVPAALGYLAGWSADRKSMEIRIIPEP